jgi:K+-transporting ATPase KdpF subunit
MCFGLELPSGSFCLRLATCGSATAFGEEIAVSIESVIMLLVSAGLMVYLLYALLRPEKF